MAFERSKSYAIGVRDVVLVDDRNGAQVGVQRDCER